MADYFARVELHDAAWPSGYQKLHEALAVHNFTNCIASTQGNLRLPTAFYHSTNRIDDLETVAKAVKGCADSTGYKNEVIVMRDSGWYGYLSSKC
jgi:hypothetical protein